MFLRLQAENNLLTCGGVYDLDVSLILSSLGLFITYFSIPFQMVAFSASNVNSEYIEVTSLALDQVTSTANSPRDIFRLMFLRFQAENNLLTCASQVNKEYMEVTSMALDQVISPDNSPSDIFRLMFLRLQAENNLLTCGGVYDLDVSFILSSLGLFITYFSIPFQNVTFMASQVNKEYIEVTSMALDQVISPEISPSVIFRLMFLRPKAENNLLAYGGVYDLDVSFILSSLGLFIAYFSIPFQMVAFSASRVNKEYIEVTSMALDQVTSSDINPSDIFRLMFLRLQAENNLLTCASQVNKEYIEVTSMALDQVTSPDNNPNDIFRLMFLRLQAENNLLTYGGVYDLDITKTKDNQNEEGQIVQREARNAKMEEQTEQSNDATGLSVPQQETTFEEKETSPPQGTSADPLTQIADALSKLLITRSPREIDVSPYDGTFEAQSFIDNFDAQADRAELTYTDRLRKLPCYLQGKPLQYFRSLRLDRLFYNEARQTLIDLFPTTTEASFSRFLAIKLTPQMPLEDYYQNKTVMGMKLNLPADILIDFLTEGLPVADQRLIATVQPNTIKEWFDLVSRIRRTQCATSAVYQRQVDKAPHPTYHNPPPRYNNQRSSRVTYQVLHPHPRLASIAMLCTGTPSVNNGSHRTEHAMSTAPDHAQPLYQNLVPGPKSNLGALFPKSKLQAETTLQAPRATQRVPLHDQQEIQTQNEQMLQNGIIAPSVSPYVSPITLVTKRDKTKRFCFDYRKLNEIIASDVHPSPLIETILDKLSKAKYYSSVDIASAYWQVEVEPNSHCQQAFTTLKESLTSKPVLHLYQVGLPCRLYCDASTQGIAGILKQVHPDGQVHPVQYFSRALRAHERNYTVSELECLAIVESVDKFRIYLTGRLFRWSLRLSTYNNEIHYLKGSQQYEADLLSRNPFVGFVSAYIIKQHQPTTSPFNIDTNGLHTITRKGVIKIIIPKTLQHTLMNKVHQEYNHPGISQMTRIITAQYYWKGISKSIEKFVKSCHTCQIIKRPKGKPYGALGQIPPPQQPFDLISIDTIAGFSKYGHSKTYLHVIVDHLTRYAWTFPSKSTSTLTYIQTLKTVLQQGSPKREMEELSKIREAARGRFAEQVNSLNAELKDPSIDRSGIYARYDRLESLHLELVALNEQCQGILLAQEAISDDEIDKEFEECETYIMERFYLEARIRVMREQDRDALSTDGKNGVEFKEANIKGDKVSSDEYILEVDFNKEELEQEEIASEKCEDANLKNKEDSEAESKGDRIGDSEAETKGNGVKDSGTAIKGYESMNNSKAVAEGADQVKISDDETKSIDDNEERVVKVQASRKLVEARPTGNTEFKIKDNYKETESQDLKIINKSDYAENKDDKYNGGKDHDGNEAKNIDAEQGTDSKVEEEKLDVEQGTDSKVEEKLDVEQGTDSKVEEKLDVEQGTDSKVEEKLDAEQGTDSKVGEKIIDPKDWLNEGFIEGVNEDPPEVKGRYLPRHFLFKSGSKTTPIRPVFDDASCRGYNGLSLKRYLRRGPILLRRIPEIGIKLRENKFGVLADMRRYFQVMAIKENDWDYLRFLWKKKMDAYGAISAWERFRARGGAGALHEDGGVRSSTIGRWLDYREGVSESILEWLVVKSATIGHVARPPGRGEGDLSLWLGAAKAKGGFRLHLDTSQSPEVCGLDGHSQEPLFKSTAKSVNRLPANSSVTMQWRPAHVVIPGNELADSLAKAGALGLPEAKESITQLDERDFLRTIKTQCLKEWKSNAAHHWHRAGRTNTCYILTREQQSLISRLKSGNLQTMTFQNSAREVGDEETQRRENKTDVQVIHSTTVAFSASQVNKEYIEVTSIALDQVTSPDISPSDIFRLMFLRLQAENNLLTCVAFSANQVNKEYLEVTSAALGQVTSPDNSPSDIFRLIFLRLQAENNLLTCGGVYDLDCIDIKNVRKWCREFNEGRINVHDEQRSGRPSLPESTVARIDEMVCANRRITLEEIEDGLNEDCSHFSVHKIVSETLGYRKVSARWVDKWLKEAVGECQVNKEYMEVTSMALDQVTSTVISPNDIFRLMFLRLQAENNLLTCGGVYDLDVSFILSSLGLFITYFSIPFQMGINLFE
ncbi:hypothetical protein LAZ67_7003341 [Cordylochernes scorpioides]|uniref:RNA-directed DNA polymerase n=1 Tax=Cordylochernes scorpioides TaxID=51811 RepID=A0ABY6KS03_9ARAC|nr:hypothetical protein LAZ67_7003341 [Cordylochernes scorpioides]